MTQQTDHRTNNGRRNRRVAIICVGVVAGMVGLAYASVPLYRIFCQVTGFGGTPRVADAGADRVLEETVKVRFDANVSRDLAWHFKPERNVIEVKLGETRLAFYKARNEDQIPVTGTATFNVTPDWAAQYFNKIDCFCFTEQTLAPGETADMPVQFFVDPDILQDPAAISLDTLTLSYTFFPAAEQPQKAADSAARPGAKKSGGRS